MVPEDRTTIDTNSPGATSDVMIERGIQLLLVFTLAAFGAVQSWAAAVMEILSFAILGIWAVSMVKSGRIEIIRTPVLYFWAAVIGILLIQLLPLPMPLLTSLSPETAVVLADAGVAGPGSWHTLSLHPQATRDELYKNLAYFSIFLTVIHTYRTPRQVKRLVSTMVSLGVILVLFAVLQKGTWNGKLYWFYPVQEGIVSNLTYVWGPFINRNHFAGYLEIVAPLGMGLMLYRMSRVRPVRGQTKRGVLRFLSNKDLPQVLGLGAAVFVVSGGIFLCISRGGIMGLTASSLVFLLLMKSRRAFRKRAHLVLIIGSALALVAATAAGDRIAARFDELADPSRIMRANMWPDAAAMTAKFPVFGTGGGSFNDIFPRYQKKYSTFRFEHAENDYLETAAELGFAGLTLALGLAVAYFRSVFRAWKARKNLYVTGMAAGGMASCTAMLVHGMTDFNLRVPANAMLLTVVAALTFALVHNVRSGKEPYGA